MNSSRRNIFAVAIAAAVSFAAGVYFAASWDVRSPPKLDHGVSGAQTVPEPEGETAKTEPPMPADSVELAEIQLKAVKVETVGERDFPVEKAAVGSIDFNEELVTQVFTPYQGRIVGLFAKVGDEVMEGETLFTIDSPDLLQASSTLIAAAGVLELTSRNLERLKMLYATRAVSQKDLEQASSDQQTAQGAFRAARDALRIFGKTDADIDRIVSERRVDPTLVVSSPISGRITARNAAPGLLVQPAIHRHPIRLPTFRPCGCSPMLPKATARPSRSARRSRSASWPIRAGCS
jgi:cobalt-zinc-cadmium efflux system membrane fusion protein